MPTMTVSETCNFYATMLLPKTTSKAQRNERIAEVLAAMGLSHTVNTLVRLWTVRPADEFWACLTACFASNPSNCALIIAKCLGSSFAGAGAAHIPTLRLGQGLARCEAKREVCDCVLPCRLVAHFLVVCLSEGCLEESGRGWPLHRVSTTQTMCLLSQQGTEIS